MILMSSKRSPGLAALAIPLTLVAIHFAIATLTGSSVNPARSIGSALIGGDLGSSLDHIVGPTVGGVIGWGVIGSPIANRQRPNGRRQPPRVKSRCRRQRNSRFASPATGKKKPARAISSVRAGSDRHFVRSATSSDRLPRRVDVASSADQSPAAASFAWRRPGVCVMAREQRRTPGRQPLRDVIGGQLTELREGVHTGLTKCIGVSGTHAVDDRQVVACGLGPSLDLNS